MVVGSPNQLAHIVVKNKFKNYLYTTIHPQCVLHILKNERLDDYAIGNNINIKRKLCRFDYVTIIYFDNNDYYYFFCLFSRLNVYNNKNFTMFWADLIV